MTSTQAKDLPVQDGPWVIKDVNTGKWWTGGGWSKDKNKAAPFGYEYFAHEGAKGLNDGIGMRVERR